VIQPYEQWGKDRKTCDASSRGVSCKCLEASMNTFPSCAQWGHNANRCIGNVASHPWTSFTIAGPCFTESVPHAIHHPNRNCLVPWWAIAQVHIPHTRFAKKKKKKDTLFHEEWCVFHGGKWCELLYATNSGIGIHSASQSPASHSCNV